MAGHETTATLILWTFHALSTRPQIVSRLKKELKQVLGDRQIESHNDLDHLESDSSSFLSINKLDHLTFVLMTDC